MNQYVIILITVINFFSAQRWADQCPSNPPHDSNRKTPKYRMEPGQNKADSWSSLNNFNWDLTKKVQNWYNEHKDFPSENVQAFSQNGATGVIGHYTQVVWGETEFIGCGVMYYKDDSAPRFPYRKVMCEFGRYMAK